jgi:hypothetical protein
MTRRNLTQNHVERGGGRVAGCAGHGLGRISRRVDMISWTGQDTVVMPLRGSAALLASAVLRRF